ncbi:MAG: class I SAM-dependent methyltransferase [Planctomycetota bacterium]
MVPDLCTLCASKDVAHFAEVRGRVYWRCASCRLVFVAESEHLSRDEEAAVYDLHENSPNDEGYVAFLSRLVDPLTPYLGGAKNLLDFGCGPGPALGSILRARNLDVDVVEYDPIYQPSTLEVDRAFDVIVATEVIEHARRPRELFEQCRGLLRRGGVFAVMTETRLADRDFSAWWYVRDPTHIAFYEEWTFRVVAEIFSWRVEIPRKNVAFFRSE